MAYLWTFLEEANRGTNGRAFTYGLSGFSPGGENSPFETGKEKQEMRSVPNRKAAGGKTRGGKARLFRSFPDEEDFAVFGDDGFGKQK